MIGTNAFPQADRILKVGQVAVAVARGCRTDEEIERLLRLDSGNRQGRYYRHAAELLGLIWNSENIARLTAVGNEYAKLSAVATNATLDMQLEYLGRCLVDTPIFRSALQYIQDGQPTADQLKAWFVDFYPGRDGTALRRFSTFLNYLTETGLVVLGADGRYLITRFHGAIIRNHVPIAEGIPGIPVDPDEIRQYSIRTNDNAYEFNAVAHEKANQTHWRLVSGKSAFLKRKGYDASENSRIDLFSEGEAGKIIYEMKSVSDLNIISQPRKAVAQLYEYRYIFSAPSAKLCIVTNAALSDRHQWLMNYLARDRCIAYVWTEDFVDFECSADSHSILEEFSPYQ